MADRADLPLHFLRGGRKTVKNLGYSGFSVKKYSPQRHTRLRRNQKNRDISRKDAKAAKKEK